MHTSCIKKKGLLALIHCLLYIFNAVIRKGIQHFLAASHNFRNRFKSKNLLIPRTHTDKFQNTVSFVGTTISIYFVTQFSPDFRGKVRHLRKKGVFNMCCIHCSFGQKHFFQNQLTLLIFQNLLKPQIFLPVFLHIRNTFFKISHGFCNSVVVTGSKLSLQYIVICFDCIEIIPQIYSHDLDKRIFNQFRAYLNHVHKISPLHRCSSHCTQNTLTIFRYNLPRIWRIFR